MQPGAVFDNEMKKTMAEIYEEQGEDLMTFEVMIILVHKE